MKTKEQIIIDKVSPDLPITVFPNQKLEKKLREHFEDETINYDSELEVHSLQDMGEMGGIVGEIRTPGMDTKKSKGPFLCSITHFKIKKGEPHYTELMNYIAKRTGKLRKEGLKTRRRGFSRRLRRRK